MCIGGGNRAKVLVFCDSLGEHLAHNGTAAQSHLDQRGCRSQKRCDSRGVRFIIAVKLSNALPDQGLVNARLNRAVAPLQNLDPAQSKAKQIDQENKKLAKYPPDCILSFSPKVRDVRESAKSGARFDLGCKLRLVLWAPLHHLFG